MSPNKIPKDVTITGNTFVIDNKVATVLEEAGEAKPDPPGNQIIKDRATAKLPAYPASPALPAACAGVQPPVFPH